MKLYVLITFMLTCLIFLVGFLLPALFSAKSDMAVMLGYLLIVIGLPFFAWAIKSLIDCIR
jgi:hypothetical protein